MSGHSDKRRGDALVILLLLLSVTTGLVDAVSVLGLGKVFTANMTGNVVFLGFAIAGVPGFSWPLYIIALLCFALGAVFAGRIAARHSESGRRRWLLRGATAETALLWLAALIAVIAPPAGGNGAVYAMIALTAAAMGARNTTIRQLKVADLTTTVLTLTITGLASEFDACRRRQSECGATRPGDRRNPRWRRRRRTAADPFRASAAALHRRPRGRHIDLAAGHRGYRLKRARTGRKRWNGKSWAPRGQGRADHRRGVGHRPSDGGSVPRRRRQGRGDRPQ